MCDPVLGDEGRLYVSQELIDAYRSTIVPLCDVITPNQFEAEVLTGMRVADEASALAAARALHELGPATVVRRLCGASDCAQLPRQRHAVCGYHCVHDIHTCTCCSR